MLLATVAAPGPSWQEKSLPQPLLRRRTLSHNRHHNTTDFNVVVRAATLLLLTYSDYYSCRLLCVPGNEVKH